MTFSDFENEIYVEFSKLSLRFGYSTRLRVVIELNQLATCVSYVFVPLYLAP